MNARRLILYLILNVLVSASATLAVLWWWDQTHPSGGRPAAAAATPVRYTSGAPTAGPGTQAATLAAPVETVPPAPSATQTVYAVQPGDTLGSIAQQFDLPLEAILSANGLTDPNLLNVGQQLIIPVPGGPPPASATPAALPTNAAEPPLPTATRDPSLPLPRLSIREVAGAGDLANETLILVNSGGPVDLAGWTLRDEVGHLYTFPSLTLFQNGAVNLHTAAGENTVVDLYWGLVEAVWKSGRVILLTDPSGNLHTRFTLP